VAHGLLEAVGRDMEVKNMNLKIGFLLESSKGE